MSKKLEQAIEAGLTIAEGRDYPDRFTRLSVQHEITMEREVEGVYSLRYSPDGNLLAVGCNNGTIKLFETRSGRKIADLRKSRYGGYPIMVLKFHPKKLNHIYAGTSEGQILVCDISDFLSEEGGLLEFCQMPVDNEERWKEIITEETVTVDKNNKKTIVKNEINCMDFDQVFSERFATAGKDLSIRIYDAATHQLQSTYTGYNNTKDGEDAKSAGATQRVWALKFHPNNENIFITGGWENNIKIWDARCNIKVGDPIKKIIPGPHICGDALDMKIEGPHDSPLEQRCKVLTGSWINHDALQIWDYSTDYSYGGKERPINVKFPAKSQGEYLYAARFCDNDVVIAGGSGTNSAVATNTKTNEVIGEVQFDHPVTCIDVACGGRMIAIGDGKRSLKLCGLS